MIKQKLFLTIALLLGTLAPHSVLGYDFSAVAPTGQTLYYTITNSNTHTVSVVSQFETFPYYSNYVRPSGCPFYTLEIPASVTNNGTTYSVTGIGDHAFYGCTRLTSVTIPNSVTSIGHSAFCYCSGLTGSLTIPNSVTSIGYAAFCNCFSMISITIGNSVTSIGDSAFYDCTGLTSLTIPNSVTGIGACAFYHCTGLTGELTIPNSVTSIGEWAFGNCSRLTSVTIPNSVISLNLGTFQSCTGLTSVTLGNSVTSIGQQAFYGCTGLTSITIPNSVTGIGDYAFFHCTGLTSVTIPNSVISIGSWAFGNCSGLTSATIGNSVTSIGKAAFSHCTGLTGTLTIPNSVTAIGRNAFDSCINLQNVILPNNLSRIDTSLFRYCTGLTSVTIPNSVISIHNWAFYNCTGLIGALTIPNSVTSIGEDAFYGCIGLHVLDLGSGLTSVGANAFYNCDHLDSIYSRSTTPPTVANTNAFENVWKGLPLTVPAGSRNAYSIAYAWRDFTNIIESALVSQYTVTAAVNNATMGSATVNGAATATVEDGTTVTLIATPNTGYTFTQWQDGNTDNPRTVTVTADATYMAYFTAASTTQYTVIVYTNDSTMGTVSGGGSYALGATATLTATPNTGYTFTQWQDGNTDNPRTVTVTGNATYMAYFAADQSNAPQIAYVGVDSNGHNAVSWTPQSGTSPVRYNVYREGIQAGVYELVGVVNASGAASYSWTDDQSNPATRAYSYRLAEVAADNTESDLSIPHTTIHLQISQGQGDAWNLAWTPYVGFNYSTYNLYRGTDASSMTLLTTLPATATTYSDLNTGGTAYYYQIEVVQLSGAKTTAVSSRSNIVTTDPDPQTYTLTVLSADVLRGTVTGGGSYTEGTMATLTAEANEGYVFLQWQDGSTANPRNILVTANGTYMAYFTQTEGIADAEGNNVTITARDGRILVSGAEGRQVTLSDALGRILYCGTATESLTVEAPATGIYLLQVEDHPAHRISVVR